MSKITSTNIKKFINKKINNFTIISYDDETMKAKCLCDCTKIFYRHISTLRKNKTKYCESCNAKINGREFGKKIVEKFIKDNPKIGFLTLTNNFKWIKTSKNNLELCHIKCICDCGKEKYIQKNHIGSSTISCGCYRKNRKHPSKGKRAYKDYKHFAKYYITNIHNKRKNKTIELSLTVEDLDQMYDEQNGKCFYSGVKLTLPDFSLGSKYRESEYNISIDRKDSNGPYSKENCVLCTKTINRLKETLLPEEFIQICKQVAENHS